MKRPAASPPNTRPPPVATSDSMLARCSYFQSVFPVSTEIAHTAPTLSVPGAITCFALNPYTLLGSGESTVLTAVMHMFCNGKYMVFVVGLYAPAGKFLPPVV